MDTNLLLGVTILLLLAFQLRKALITKAKVRFTLLEFCYILITSQLNAIPTIGSSGIITSWIDAFKFVRHAKEIIQEGHQMVSITLLADI